MTMQINRRQFIKQLGGMIGAGAAARIATATGLSVALAYPRLTNAQNREGKIFNKQQLALLAKVADVIIPRTDTPGASDVDCHGFIDNQLFHCHSEEQQQAVVKTLEEIDKNSKGEFAKDFASLSETQQQDILLSIEKGSFFDASLRERFKFMKSLVVFGYCTSEAGATQAFAYQPVPGGFTGSIPCDENTKAWSSLAFY